MPVNPGSLSGYIDYTEELQYTVGSLIGYIEWVGTPDPIVPAEDSNIGTLLGYIEYAEARRSPTTGTLFGYIDYTEARRSPRIGAVLGYIEWVGTPDPIVPAEDSLIGDLIGYVEYRFGSDPGGPVVILSGDYQVIWLL
jgi:hypothetical protein